MGYDLGVDLGTTYTAAAVLRDGRAEIVTLGTRSLQVPSVAFLLENGELLVGEPAERRSLLQPDRFAREFKRRIGDPTPILLGGTPFSAHALTARLLRSVVGLVSAREGGPPDRIVVTCPASWSDYKRDLLEQAIRQADVGSAGVATEPETAAVHYASTTRVAPGDVVAVYDLGGGTFDATVLRNAGGRFQLLGEPQGLEHLGGVQFDDAVFAHVTRQFQPELDQLDPNDPATLTALARLRRECVEAKEALSADTEVTIPVALPNRQTEVRLTRPEFEAMIRPALADTIETMVRTLRSADLQPTDVTAVLLVGGSSRIPLIAELVASELKRPTAVDVHPKHAVAMGAALLAGEGIALPATSRSGAGAVPAPPVPPGPPGPPETVEPEPVPAPEPEPLPVPEPEPPVPEPEPQPPIPEPGPPEPQPPVPPPVPPEPPVPEPEPPVPEPEPVGPVPPSPVPEPVPSAHAPPMPEPEPSAREGGATPGRRPSRLLLVAGVVAVVAVVGALTQLGGGGGDGSGGSSSAATTGSCTPADPVSGGGEVLDLSAFSAGAPEHIDPAQTVTGQSWQLVNALYDGLTEVDSRDPENPRVVPQVASSIGSNADATRWSFTIREGLRFANGEPVLPSSFVRGWERASDPDVAGQHSAVFRFIEGGDEKLDGEAETISGLSADDEAMTLDVELAASHANFDAVVGFQPFMPMPEAVEDLDDQAEWENGVMVGNGPFKMESPRTGDEVRVVRNPEWNGTCYGDALGLPAQPALEAITFRAVDDGYGRFAAGEGDVARIPPASLDEAREAYQTTLDGPFTLTYFLAVNWEDPIVGGPENQLLRQAISQAVDRNHINDMAFGGTSRPATGVTPPAVPGFVDDLCGVCTFDMDAASDAFEQWQADGNTLTEPIRLQSVAQPGNSDQVIDSIVDNLNSIGIDAEEEPLGDDYYTARSNGECQICLVTVFPAYLSYDSTLFDNFHSTSIGRDNFGRFSDAAFDGLVDQGRETSDPAEQVEVYRQAERRLLDDQVGTIPILWSSSPFAYGDHLEGFTVNELGQIVWERVSLSG